MKDNGFPLTTEPNILLEMISPPNIVSKVLSVVTGCNSSVSDTLSVAAASYVPWRTADPKYSNSELYVDLEEMDALWTGLYAHSDLSLLNINTNNALSSFGEWVIFFASFVNGIFTNTWKIEIVLLYLVEIY